VTASRRGGEIVNLLTSISLCPAAAQLDSNTLVQLVEAAAADAGAAGAVGLLEKLLHLPCLQDSSWEQLQRLLLAAVKLFANAAAHLDYTKEKVLKQLMQPAAAQQLPADAVAAVLAAAVEQDQPKIVAAVCRLQGAAQLSQQQLQPILLRAMQQLGSRVPAESLRSSDMAPAHARQATRDAANQSITAAVRQLFRLPAAVQLDSTAVASPLLAAVEHHAKGCSATAVSSAVAQLFDLPGASSLNVGPIRSLLAAVKQNKASCCCSYDLVTGLCDLQAAASLSSAKVGELLLMALNDGLPGAIGMLCELPNAGSIEPNVAKGLLWQLVRQPLVVRGFPGCEECSQELAHRPILGLAAVQQLGPADVHELLAYAIVKQHYDAAAVVANLCGLPGAAQINGTGVAKLLRLAMDRSLAEPYESTSIVDIVQFLCALRGAQQLDAAALGELLRDAVMCRWCKVVKALCALPAAARVEAATLHRLQLFAALASELELVAALQSQENTVL
jgi:hypothetical protein